MLKDYYSLTKPGIIRGNSISAIAGFLVAARFNFDPVLFAGMVIGLALVIASGSVFNNFIDRDIDRKMTRTKNRALVTGRIKGSHALIYGGILGALGYLVLLISSNHLAALIAMVGLFFYAIVYTYFKRKTVWGTVIGSISGAIPPVVGYTAVSNKIDTGAILLFLTLAAWQMPHFYAIGIFRMQEYMKASIPILPIVNGVDVTKKQILFYIILFSFFSQLLYVFGYVGALYFIVMIGFGIYWITFGFSSDSDSGGNDVVWAKRMFGASLLVLSGWCLAIIADRIVSMLL